MRARLRFIISGGVGLGFFLLPVPWRGRLTVPFDIAVRGITEGAPRAVAVYCLVIIALGAAATLLSGSGFHAASGDGSLSRAEGSAGQLSRFRTTGPLAALRVLGVPLAVVYFFHFGPQALLRPSVSDLLYLAHRPGA